MHRRRVGMRSRPSAARPLTDTRTMIFSSLPVRDAEGAILAHSQDVGERTFKKGRVLTAGDIAVLAAAGVAEVIAARLEDGDLDENEAARRLAAACAGPGLEIGTAATGRANVFAQADGLMIYGRDRLDAVNGVDEALTVAAVEPYARVEEGQLVATIKVIPLGVAARQVARASEAAHGGEGPLFAAAPFRPRRAGLLQTVLPGTREKVLVKTVDTLRTRLEGLGSSLVAERRADHRPEAIAGALRELRAQGCDLLLIVGASVTTDRRDCIPAGIEAAGGRVAHFGMPVDPGNLLVLAWLGDVPVLAPPGSARSPRTGGNDWVLWRLCAGLDVTAKDIMGMGAGGLLKEIPSRPLPRGEAAPRRVRIAKSPPRIAALVLAAGQSRRMGDSNKLLEEIAGTPMVLRAVDAAIASTANPVVVVTGHEHERVEALLRDRPVATVYNPDHGEGLSTSLRSGVKALSPDIDAVVVLLGDMPGVGPGTIDRLIQAFDPARGQTICVPTHGGKRGNPVLFARRYFSEMLELAGDIGAKALLGAYADQVAEVEMPDESVLLDLDTPEALDAFKNGR